MWKGSLVAGTGRFNPYKSKLSTQACVTAYILSHGEVPVNQRVKHTCSEVTCCNPFHLTLAPLVTERFWDFVDKTPGLGPNGDCWEWRGHVTKVGYGQFSVKGLRGISSSIAAHRYSLMMATDKFDQPEEVYACHHCDNRRCVRSDHLFWGTSSDNHQDRISKGRGIRKGLLTKKQVEEIKQLLAEKCYTQYDIANFYGVSQGVISRVKLGRYIHCADSPY